MCLLVINILDICRKTGLEPQSLNKRFAAEAHKQTHKNERSDRHEKQTQRRHQKSCTVTSSSEEENQDVITFKKDNKKLKQKQIVDNTCLRTDDSYYVSFYKPISDEIDTMSRGDILKQAEGQLEGESILDDCVIVFVRTNIFGEKIRVSQKF